MKYVIKNKRYGTYLNYIKRIKFNHYVVDISEATRFTKSEAIKRIKSYADENKWELVPVSEKKKTTK